MLFLSNFCLISFGQEEEDRSPAQQPAISSFVIGSVVLFRIQSEIFFVELELEMEQHPRRAGGWIKSVLVINLVFELELVTELQLNAVLLQYFK